MSPAYIPQPARDTCDTFMERARSTWNLLGQSSQAAIDISEPTLTELNLRHIQIRHPRELRIVKFCQREEGTRTGADWEWWFGAKDGWFGLRVQAKKVETNGRDYASLDYTNRHGRQIDLLIRDATRNGLTPIYCFYSWVPSPDLASRWRCGTFELDIPLFGCTVANAEVISELIRVRTTSVSDVVEIGLPWSCLVCCHGYESGSLPQRVRSVIASLPRANPEMPSLRKEAPAYVNTILEGELPKEGPAEGVPYVVVTYEGG